jgi:hypothetical protein
MELGFDARRIVPEPVEPDASHTESLGVWGFDDTRFRARPDGIVVLGGSRYELSGRDGEDLPAARNHGPRRSADR